MGKPGRLHPLGFCNWYLKLWYGNVQITIQANVDGIDVPLDTIQYEILNSDYIGFQSVIISVSSFENSTF